MCGFLGEISSTLLEPTAFKSLLDLSKQRGPDQQGLWKDQICQLGFNRLAILDVSEAGKQPILSPSGRYALVFNGEIYNYKKLQVTYNISASNLRSSSDTEVLAHILDKDSIPEIAKQLNGMFAISIWDTVLKQLTLIRDFSGIKPLYYGMKQEQIIFASQFDQVFKHSLFAKKELRPDAMKSFFGLGYMHAPDTVFKDIFQVEPGALVVWDFNLKQIVNKEYYYKWQVKEELLDTASKTKEVFKSSMHEVIKGQLQADVPLGTFLSSGFDSSLISAFAKEENPLIKAFTFGVDSHGKYDERQDAEAYAAILNLNHETATVQEADLLAIIDAHFKAMPEPFGDYSSIPTYVICQKARKFATVMLSGDGGDELFWGYPRFRTSLNQAHWFQYPLWSRKIILPILRRLKQKLPWGVQMFPRFSDWILNKQVHFSDIHRFMPKTNFTDSVYKSYQYNSSLKKEEVLQYLKKNEFHAHMQRVLKKVDLASMSHSLEVRVPFLDKEMIAFSNRIKSGFTIDHDETKIILKSSLYDYIPKEIVNKEKKGFSVPIASWLHEELKEDFKHTILERPFYGAEHVDLKFLKITIASFFNKNSSVDVWGLWHVYAWQKWAIHHELV
ncbi:asparagine synthase (glutamine-hydrolyzing) [Oceanihabitans sp. 2_MG-2023]|uniref:asparagine synthase (glutamine-hydrolyzing) n=1 Tax=Oceanihabitans sp. 2_MG-2023 TaxID=3062661 RepID=UPI0026E35B36|nr:asparagine synthase (glutamine-hydrolyzing) [Oceanihabitans sp. 2_MG-2023]MDO6597689.1 asparagine synthase (glutamine-hydrolyzing) [Oceanihabitans sp. 2_MG-2023]